MMSKPLPNDIIKSDKYLWRVTRGKLYYIEKSKFIQLCNEIDEQNKKRGTKDDKRNM